MLEVEAQRAPQRRKESIMTETKPSRRQLRNAQVAAFFARPFVLVEEISLPEGEKFKGAFGEVGRNGYLIAPVENLTETYIVGKTNMVLGRELRGENVPQVVTASSGEAKRVSRRASAAAEIAALPALVAPAEALASDPNAPVQLSIEAVLAEIQSVPTLEEVLAEVPAIKAKKSRQAKTQDGPTDAELASLEAEMAELLEEVESF